MHSHNQPLNFFIMFSFLLSNKYSSTNHFLSFHSHFSQLDDSLKLLDGQTIHCLECLRN
jgi:hypothetical protein